MVNEKKDPEKKERPHINLKPIEGTRTRGIGRAIIEPIAKPITDKDFISKINDVIESSSVKLMTKTNTYLLLELTIPYYSKEVSHALNKLKLQLKSVLGDYRLLVATESENLSSYIQGKIRKGVLKVIKDIKRLESSSKIGRSLQNIMREDVDRKRAVNILIGLLSNLDEEETRSCIENLKALLNRERSITLHPNSRTVSCVCSTAVISKVADLPFIQLITEFPRIQETPPLVPSDKEEHLLYNYDELSFKEKPSTLPPICIIDSGISPVLDNFVIDKGMMYTFFNSNETIPHGTSVASVAIFGEDLLRRKKVLESKTKVISFKIDDRSISREDVHLEESVMEAIRKYKTITPIFNLSYNYDEIPDEYRTEMIKKLDKFIQSENVIVVNSAGNISLDKTYLLDNRYPKYLTEHAVFAPAEGRTIFSVGSICFSSTQQNIKHSKHTRIGIPPVYQNEEIDKYLFFKPDIHTYGGDTVPNSQLRRNIVSVDKGFPVIATNGSMILECGTSYSAPLISLCFSRLYGKFGRLLKNSETYKAILLNQANYASCNGFTTFSLLDTERVGECTDAVYLNFEGESEPHEKAENKKRTQIIKCKKLKFHVPPEADNIDVVVVHSNNYEEQDPKDFKTKVILKLVKPSGTTLKKEYGNIGKNSAITYARYKLGRDYSGEWNAELHIETSGIPKELFDRIKVRFGVSLKINLKEDARERIQDIYDSIKENTKSINSQKETVPQYIKVENEPVKVPPQIIVGGPKILAVTP